MEIELSVKFEECVVVAFTWPDHSLPWELADWLRLFPREQCFQQCVYGVEAARNLAVREICKKAPPQIKHFIFVDRDMRPEARTMGLFEPEADIVGCMYPVPDMAAWVRPDDLHLGLVRFSRKVADSLPLPWFLFDHSADGCLVEKCECRHFIDLAKANGFTVARAGWCGHSKY